MMILVNGGIVLSDKNESVIVGAFRELGIEATEIICDETSCVVSVNVKVKPGSKCENIKLDEEGILAISFSAKPVEGEANKYVKKFLAKKLGISSGSVELISGEKSKNKKLYLSFANKVGKDDSYYVARVKKLLED